MSITDLAITGANAGEFAFTSATLTITLTPGNSTTVNVTFTPVATGTRTATLVVTDNTGTLYSISLSGNAPDVAQNANASVAINPGSGQAGTSLTVQITGNLTSFLQGATTANFGPGMTVDNGAGLVTVASATQAAVQVQVGAQAATGHGESLFAPAAIVPRQTFNVLAAGPVAVANAGPQQFVTVGSTVQLDGSHSTCASNSSGCALTFQWSWLSVPEGSGAHWPTRMVRLPALWGSAGDYLAELAVSDGTTSTLASVLISTVNTSPVAHAGAEQYVAVGTRCS